MKICFVSGSFPNVKDGVGDYTKFITHYLAKKQVKISVITSRRDEIIAKKHREIDVYPIIKVWNFRALFIILQEIKKINPGIIHIQYPSKMYGKRIAVNFLPVFLKLFYKRCKIISTIHGFEVYTILGKLRMLISAVACDKIIAVSNLIADDLQKFCPFKKLKVEVIPIGSNILADAKLFAIDKSGLRKKLKLETDSFIISYFGFIDNKKGVNVLISSLKKLINNQINVRLLLLAELNPEVKYHQYIINLIQEYQLEDYIKIIGYCTPAEVSQYLIASDICALPFTYGVSTKRGSFIVAIEHGLPTITTLARPLPASFKNYENVILIKPNSAEELYDALINLIDSKQLRKKIAVNAKKLANTFSWEKIVLQHKKFYKSL